MPALEKRCECSELQVSVQGFESFKQFKTFKLFNPIGVRTFAGCKLAHGLRDALQK
jgi:hypothetical protein